MDYGRQQRNSIKQEVTPQQLLCWMWFLSQNRPAQPLVLGMTLCICSVSTFRSPSGNRIYNSPQISLESDHSTHSQFCPRSRQLPRSTTVQAGESLSTLTFCKKSHWSTALRRKC